MPAPPPRRSIPDALVHLSRATLWTTGPLAALGERARLLWLRLATGPEGTIIPGVVLARAEVIAASLGWSPEEVERVAATIPGTALRADWRAGVQWLAPLLRSQPPNSPKNVLGWRAPWAAIPPTPIADEIHEELRLHCGLRGAAFARALEALPPQPAAPALEAPATIDILGTRITASGIREGSQAELAVAFARAIGVEVEVVRPAAVELPAPAPGPAPLALPAMGGYVAPPAPRGRRTKQQTVLDERGPELDRILEYQDRRRREAFALAEKAPTPIDREECRKALAALLAAGRTPAEMMQVCDRIYEKVGGEPTAGRRAAEATWWTPAIWSPRRVAELLRLDLGGSAASGVGPLTKLINEAAPGGASPLSPLSVQDTRPISALLEMGQDAPTILATVGAFASVVLEQERQFGLRARDVAAGEERLLKLWGARMFRVAAWTAVQTAVERFEGGHRGTDLFCDVSLALAADASGRSARSG